MRFLYAAGSGASPHLVSTFSTASFPLSGVTELLLLELSNFWMFTDFYHALN